MLTESTLENRSEPSDGILWDAKGECWSVSDGLLVRQCLQGDGKWLSSNFVTLQEEKFEATGFGRPSDLTELSENVLTQQDGCYHDYLRAAVSPVFNRLVKAARPAFQRSVESCVANLDSQFDLVTDLAEPISSQALAIILDLPATRQTSLIARGLDVLELLDYDPGLSAARMLDRIQRARTALAEVSDFFEQQVVSDDPETASLGLTRALCEQRRQPKGPLLSNLEIVWQSVTTLMAGYVTTTNLISGALARMPCSPREMLADKAGFRTAFEDLIRQAGPTRYIMRRATGDASLGGVDIRAGSLVRLCLIEANADLACLADREATTHLTFVEGIHVCPGTSMAKFLLKTVIDALAAHDIHPQPHGDPIPLDRFQAISGQLSWPASNCHRA